MGCYRYCQRCTLSCPSTVTYPSRGIGSRLPRPTPPLHRHSLLKNLLLRTLRTLTFLHSFLMGPFLPQPHPFVFPYLRTLPFDLYFNFDYLRNSLRTYYTTDKIAPPLTRLSPTSPLLHLLSSPFLSSIVNLNWDTSLLLPAIRSTK